ncbi:uncharacterized protein LOC111629877 isoform X2 [Centruroides sculpturatus]|uniref:uncharacterized protein LOC111629877 isoform X2 n=1 Tax=Centruroides sculpturatus TaxID=218467 RepID=UPI000C6CEDDC|nr:uncharacterized protein LOC111629877 isoform X2 [Centruroides sculpturatus]
MGCCLRKTKSDRSKGFYGRTKSNKVHSPEHSNSSNGCCCYSKNKKENVPSSPDSLNDKSTDCCGRKKMTDLSVSSYCYDKSSDQSVKQQEEALFVYYESSNDKSSGCYGRTKNKKKDLVVNNDSSNVAAYDKSNRSKKNLKFCDICCRCCKHYKEETRLSIITPSKYYKLRREIDEKYYGLNKNRIINN